VRPGREHDTTAARAHPNLLTLIAAWVSDGQLSLADLGYEGEPDIFTIPFKKPKNGELTVDQQTYNAIHGALRCLGERANSLLKKPPTRPYAATAAAPGTSATSSQPHWSCCTTRTTGPHNPQRPITQRDSQLRGNAHFAGGGWVFLCASWSW
jgi:hypothetical protein